MNKLLLTAVALFIAAATPSHADNFAKVTVTGTVQTQKLLVPPEGRIQTTALNNNRIYKEFAVSKVDYELVVSFAIGAEIVLLPKRASAMLPTISVFNFVGGAGSSPVANTKTRHLKLASGIASSGTGNLFENLAGQIIATARYINPTGSVFDKFSFTALAVGTDQATQDSALLQFKLVSGAPFKQAP